MSIYFMFIFVLNISFEKEGKNGEHDIIYFKEYDITKNTYNNKISAGKILTLIMKIEENYDLDQLTLRHKTEGLIDNEINLYLCSFYPDYFTYTDCEKSYGTYKRINLNNGDLNIYQYYYKDIKYENAKYLAFHVYANSETSFWSVFAFPLKIFNLTDSNELSINSYYPNRTIPENSCFYIRVLQNITEAKIQFKVPHNSNITFNLKVDGIRRILNDDQIKAKENYQLKADLLKIYNYGTFDNYIYNIKSTSEKPYILVFAELLNTLDYLSISIFNHNADEHEQTDDNQDSETQKSDIPENSKDPDDDDDSNFPVLIIIIIILSCVILIFVGYYLFKKFKKKYQSNEIEQNFRTLGSVTSQPILTPLNKSIKSKD